MDLLKAMTLLANLLHFFCIPRWLHANYGFHLLGVCLYPLLGHHKPDELLSRHFENTFARVELHFILPQGLECLAQIR